MNVGNVSGGPPPPSGLLHRLRERGGLRVAASYAFIAWLIPQIASIVLDPLGVSKRAMTALIIAAATGLPLAIAREARTRGFAPEGYQASLQNRQARPIDAAFGGIVPWLVVDDYSRAQHAADALAQSGQGSDIVACWQLEIAGLTGDFAAVTRLTTGSFNSRTTKRCGDARPRSGWLSRADTLKRRSSWPQAAHCR